MDVRAKISALVKRLYPDGHANRVLDGSFKERLHKALGNSIAEWVDNATDILNHQLPDNDIFNDDDATIWEKRLGIYRELPLSLSDRIKAIVRKLNHPGVVKARESRIFMEWSLRQAGFDVYVYENRFEITPGVFTTYTPSDLLGYSAMDAECGAFEYGELEYGSSADLSGVTVIANYVDEEKDRHFPITNYKPTFFIAGPTAGEFATVTATRKIEFRQTILLLKPLQTVGFLFVNYI